MLGNFPCFCCHLLTFFKNIPSETNRVSNDLEPDQDRLSVGPDLGPKLFCKGYQQRTKVAASIEKSYVFIILLRKGTTNQRSSLV